SEKAEVITTVWALPCKLDVKGKGDVAPVEQTGTDTVSRTAFTAGVALLQIVGGDKLIIPFC
ncbi:hypothetical protein, partial [Klebsiella quasipneumoniae]|uniref:hypothetical protein n=1 Tax=Klebsiella quasipneumoniae TaxID=1463165 RepID=UPI001C54CF48